MSDILVSLTLVIPESIRCDSVKAESYFRSKYLGVQVRLSGLQFGPFPHKKRTPYITMGLDGSGYVSSATLHCSSTSKILDTVNVLTKRGWKDLSSDFPGSSVALRDMHRKISEQLLRFAECEYGDCQSDNFLIKGNGKDNRGDVIEYSCKEIIKPTRHCIVFSIKQYCNSTKSSKMILYGLHTERFSDRGIGRVLDQVTLEECVSMLNWKNTDLIHIPS